MGVFEVLTICKGTPGRVLETARRAEDLSPTGGGTAMG